MTRLMNHIVIGAAIAAFPLVHVAQGAVLIDENFDSRTVGDSFPGSASSPGTPADGDWVWSWPNPAVEGNSIVKVAGPVGTNLTQSAELVKIHADPTTPALITQWANGAGESTVSSGPLDVKFSLKATTANISNVAFIGDVWGPNMVTRLFTFNATSLFASTRNAEGQFDDAYLGDVLAPDVWANIEVIADLDADTFQVKVNGITRGPSSIPFSSDWNLATGKPWKLEFSSINNAPLADGGANGTTMNIDNIVVSTEVPEPASLGLAAAAGGVLLLGRRRARKA